VDFPIDRPTRKKERATGALQRQSLTNRVKLPTDRYTVFTRYAGIPRNRDADCLRFLHQAIEPGLGNASERLSCARGHFEDSSIRY
jgi:hypothetical protein